MPKNFITWIKYNMALRRNIFILIGVFICFFASAQVNKDPELSQATSDTVKINILSRQGESALKTDPEKAIQQFKEALAIAQQIRDERRMCKLNSALGTAFSAANKFKEGLPYDQEALRLSKKIDDKGLIALCYDRLCTVFYNLGDYTKAIENGLESVKVSEKQNNKTLSANSYNSMGAIHLILSNYDKALENFGIALPLYIELHDSLKIASCYNNMASAYGRQAKTKEFLEYSFKALHIDKLIRDTIGEAYCYLNIADAQYKMQRSDSAKLYFDRALFIFEKIRHTEPQGYIAGNLNKANVYYEEKNWEQCLVGIKKAIDFSREVGDKRNVLYCYSFYADVYEQMGNFKEAFKNQKLYISLNDSLFNIDKNNEIAELQTRFDTEKKERAITELTQRTAIQELQISKGRYLIFGLIGVAVLIIVIAILLIGRNRLKSNQTKMEVEQKLFRSQMNPHFIFNSLIAIQNYVYKHQPSEVAGYISRFAKLMRMILENSRNEFVTVEKELDMLKHYLELQQLRFQDKFDFTVEVDENIDVESVLIPPMLSQPFIENAIEHGIMNKTDGKGKIDLKLVQLGKAIEMTITDNGIGIEQTLKMRSENMSKHASLATTITKERIEILNKKSKQKFELDIQEVKNEQGVSAGTKVRIVIPES